MSKREFARNGEVSIAFQDLGGFGGEPLLLVMGLGVSRFWWTQGFTDHLVHEGFHVVAYDQRDAGESTRFDAAKVTTNPFRTLFSKQQAAYSAEQMTDDAVAVMKAMAWPSAHLFGASMGGLLAQRTALRHPERVRSLVSFAAVPSDAKGMRVAKYMKPGVLMKLARMKFPQGREGDLQAGLRLAELLASPGYGFDQDQALEWVGKEAELGISGVRNTEAQSRQTGAKWSGGQLAELRLPTLIIHGEADQILRPSAGKDTAAAIADAKLLLLPGVGHELPRQLWPMFAEQIRLNALRAS